MALQCGRPGSLPGRPTANLTNERRSPAPCERIRATPTDSLLSRIARREPHHLHSKIALWFYRFSLLMGRFEYGPRGVLDETHVHLFAGAILARGRSNATLL